MYGESHVLLPDRNFILVDPRKIGKVCGVPTPENHTFNLPPELVYTWNYEYKQDTENGDQAINNNINNNTNEIPETEKSSGILDFDGTNQSVQDVVHQQNYEGTVETHPNLFLQQDQPDDQFDEPAMPIDLRLSFDFSPFLQHN